MQQHAGYLIYEDNGTGGVNTYKHHDTSTPRLVTGKQKPYIKAIPISESELKGSTIEELEEKYPLDTYKW